MTRWDDLPPTGAQLWVYRHRKVLRVISAIGLLAAVTLAAVRLLSGDGIFSALISLAAGGGFASMLISAHAVQRAIEDRGRRGAGADGL